MVFFIFVCFYVQNSIFHFSFWKQRSIVDEKFLLVSLFQIVKCLQIDFRRHSLSNLRTYVTVRTYTLILKFLVRYNLRCGTVIIFWRNLCWFEISHSDKKPFQWEIEYQYWLSMGIFFYFKGKTHVCIICLFVKIIVDLFPSPCITGN